MKTSKIAEWIVLVLLVVLTPALVRAQAVASAQIQGVISDTAGEGSHGRGHCRHQHCGSAFSFEATPAFCVGECCDESGFCAILLPRLSPT
jgi:hypothetical protein